QHWVDDLRPAGSWLDGRYADPDKMWDGDDNLALLAAFDYLTGNTDRHTGNWGTQAVTGDLTAYDNGLAFPNGLQDFYQAQWNHMWTLRRAAYQKPLLVPKQVTEWKK